MTYTPETTPTESEDPLTLLPGLPYGPDIIITSGMRAVLPGLILRILAMINPEHVERGALARLWEARRMFASVYRTEVYNLRMWLINTMTRDREWQSQVREDLGGEAALKRWDKRYARMRSGETPEEPKRPAATTNAAAIRSPSTSRKSSKVRTDRYNLFRLAKISNAKNQPRANTPPSFTPSRVAWLAFPKPPLIPLTPDQLREPKPVTVEHYGEDGVKTAILSGSTHNMPTPTRPAIMARWHQIRHKYALFNFKIMNLDLMINSYTCRQWPQIPV